MKLNCPEDVGVPDMSPVPESSIIPIGNDPLLIVQVMLPVPPDCDNCWLYIIPTSPAVKFAGEIVIGQPVAWVMVTNCPATSIVPVRGGPVFVATV